MVARKAILPTRKMIFRFADRLVGVAPTSSRTEEKEVFANEEDHFPKQVTQSSRRRAGELFHVLFQKDFLPRSRAHHILQSTTALFGKRLRNSFAGALISTKGKRDLPRGNSKPTGRLRIVRASICASQMIVGNDAARSIAHVQN
jgi:hypothetical protein